MNAVPVQIHQDSVGDAVDQATCEGYPAALNHQGGALLGKSGRPKVAQVPRRVLSDEHEHSPTADQMGAVARDGCRVLAGRCRASCRRRRSPAYRGSRSPPGGETVIMRSSSQSFSHATGLFFFFCFIFSPIWEN